jgi:hypothetical protein
MRLVCCVTVGWCQEQATYPCSGFGRCFGGLEALGGRKVSCYVEMDCWLKRGSGGRGAGGERGGIWSLRAWKWLRFGLGLWCSHLLVVETDLLGGFWSVP